VPFGDLRHAGNTSRLLTGAFTPELDTLSRCSEQGSWGEQGTLPTSTTANTLALHCDLYLTALVEGGSRWRPPPLS
jgi:hypothetical protein